MAPSSPRADNHATQLRGLPWKTLLAIAVAVGVCYAPVISRLADDWLHDENVSHGVFVPIVAAYIVWQEREKLLAAKWSPHWLGLAVILGAGLQLYVATLGVELFLARTALVFTIIGIVLYLGGFEVLKRLAFPLFLLFFMIPLPAVIYNQITFPLQLLASRLAEHSLGFVGIPVLREGNILETPHQRLSVVEACSGIRSLLSLSFLALVYGYFFERRQWLRVVLLVATVPIAIAANAFRVTLTGVLGEYDESLAEGAFHLFEGWVVFVVALGLLVGFHRAVTLFLGSIGSRNETPNPSPPD